MKQANTHRVFTVFKTMSGCLSLYILGFDIYLLSKNEKDNVDKYLFLTNIIH